MTLSVKRAGRLLVTIGSVVVCLSRGDVRAQPSGHSERSTARIVEAAEFPENDGAWVLQKRGQTRGYIRARLAAGQPGLDLVTSAWQAERPDLAVALLLRYIGARADADEQTVDSIRQTWRYSGRRLTTQDRSRADRILAGVAVIRQRLAGHPREQAARIAWQLLLLDHAVGGAGTPRIDVGRRAAFIQQWSGTTAAQFAEIEGQLEPPIKEGALESVEQIARAHGGTEVGAKAWTEIAATLSAGDIPIPGTPIHHADPTERYLRLQSALEALQTGYPSSEWARRVPGLGSRYWMVLPVFGPGGPARLLAAYQDFLTRQLSAPRIDDSAVDTLSWGASETMPWLLSAGRIDPISAMEPIFDAVERAVPNQSVLRYLRGQFYLRRCATGTDAPNPPMCQKARTALAALAGESPGRYSRLALSKLAAELLAEGEYGLARAQLLSYVERYPDGDWAWVAALRAGQCSDRLGERERARDEYRRAARQNPMNPVARVLGLTYAGRISESSGDKERALADYRAAKQAWDGEYGQSYSFGDPLVKGDQWSVTRRSLDLSIERLSR
jgi:hypothetical protein